MASQVNSTTYLRRINVNPQTLPKKSKRKKHKLISCDQYNPDTKVRQGHYN